ncbi:MAG: HD domain-containing protein [Candidatus Diapherotrites archaeon]|nr:HD domain-containing protein [Candidatus Diapherotrites archaeon]
MEKIAKKKPLSLLKEGESVDDVFVVKIKKGFIHYSNGFAFELVLSDNSGKSLTYKYWGGPDEQKVRKIYDSIKPDCVVRVKGKVSTYKGKLELTTNEPDTIEVIEKGRYDETSFVRVGVKNTEELYNKVTAEIDNIKDEKLRRMVKNIYCAREISEKIKKHPGAIEIHHNWLGGLLEHIWEVVELCKKVCEFYPAINKDILIAGALLHDIGKLEELEITSRIKSTTRGQLLGHITLGAVFLERKCQEFEIDEMTKNKLLHIVVSHHGKQEYGSPKEPMFAEALIVYYADELSSKTAEIYDFIEGAKNDTEDDFMFYDRIKRNVLLR